MLAKILNISPPANHSRKLLFLNFPHQTILGIFKILSFSYLIFVFDISNSPLYPIGKTTPTMFWKTRDGIVKRREIWVSRNYKFNIYGGTFYLVAFKVIWGSFGALRKIRFFKMLFLLDLGFSYSQTLTAVPCVSPILKLEF